MPPLTRNHFSVCLFVFCFFFFIFLFFLLILSITNLTTCNNNIIYTTNTNYNTNIINIYNKNKLSALFWVVQRHPKALISLYLFLNSAKDREFPSLSRISDSVSTPALYHLLIKNGFSADCDE